MADESEDDQQEPVAAPPEAPETPGRRSGGSTVAMVLAAVFAATSVLLAVLAVSYKSDADEAQTGQHDVEFAASRFAETLISWDADIESLRDDVLPYAVGEFREEFGANVEAVFDLAASLGHVSTRATIEEVYTSAVSGSEARAIVVYTAVSTFEDGRAVTSENQHMRLGLIEVDGDWKVATVVDLLELVSTAGEPDLPTGTTATTAPAG